MPGQNFLFVPGPTNVPERIMRAMVGGMEDHRSSRFPELTLSLLTDLKRLFQTESGQPFIFSATGTGAWEAALCNTLSPGDRLLAPRFGQFSHLWIDLAKRHGLDPQVLEVPWGNAVPLDQMERMLAEDTNHTIKGVLLVHNETSTGVCNDIRDMRRILDDTKHPALLYVDGVSSIGSIDFRMDEWGVDLAITGSQKGLMLPPGLGMVCASPRALKVHRSATCTRGFFDFADMIKANANGYFPYTPPLSLLYGLRESLNMLFEEGLDAVFARHHRLAEGVRTAVQAWKLDFCAQEPQLRSDTVTAIVVPPEFNAAHVIDVAFRRYDLALGAGLAELAGKVFRIGHLGDLNEVMVLGALAGTEMAMRDVNMDIVAGSGVAAAEEYFSRTDPIPKKKVSREQLFYEGHSTGSLY
ncbi:MAG: aminotransferase class V-fold PLP-dependent enzyme [Arenicellales bacterium]|nr:aminotransferase class V-fold PLP-dependent enzyme [Arenicellales bacterium]